MTSPVYRSYDIIGRCLTLPESEPNDYETTLRRHNLEATCIENSTYFIYFRVTRSGEAADLRDLSIEEVRVIALYLKREFPGVRVIFGTNLIIDKQDWDQNDCFKFCDTEESVRIEDGNLAYNRSYEEIFLALQQPLYNLRKSFLPPEGIDHVHVDYNDRLTRHAYLFYYAAPYGNMTRLLLEAHNALDNIVGRLMAGHSCSLGFFGAGPGMEAWAVAEILSASIGSKGSVEGSLTFYFFDINDGWKTDRGRIFNIVVNELLPRLNCRNEDIWFDITKMNCFNENWELLENLDLILFQYCMNETIANPETSTSTISNLENLYHHLRKYSPLIIIDDYSYRTVEQKLRELANSLDPTCVVHRFEDPLHHNLRTTDSGQLIVFNKNDSLPEYLVNAPVPFEKENSPPVLNHWRKRYINSRILILQESAQ
jgi:hypothetical protein